MSTTRSTADLLGRKSWTKRRPLIRNAIFTDLQRGSYIASIFTLVQSIISQVLSVFDIYCLIEASPGTTHYRYFGINFLFVYSGNKHVRNALVLCAIISFIMAVYVLVVSVILMRALRKEQEKRFRPWLTAALIYTTWSLFSILFRSIANDLYYSYHQAMLIIWAVFISLNVFFILVVYSNYQELEDITRLEDIGSRLKLGTVSSLNTTSHSLSHYSVEMFRGPHGPQSRSSTPHGSITPQGSITASV